MPHALSLFDKLALSMARFQMASLDVYDMIGGLKLADPQLTIDEIIDSDDYPVLKQRYNAMKKLGDRAQGYFNEYLDQRIKSVVTNQMFFEGGSDTQPINPEMVSIVMKAEPLGAKGPFAGPGMSREQTQEYFSKSPQERMDELKAQFGREIPPSIHPVMGPFPKKIDPESGLEEREMPS